jgi:hypothetical protein
VLSNLFLLAAFFYRCFVKILQRYFKTLSMAEKVRLMAGSEEEISTTAIVGRLGRHCTLNKCLLA